jgi:predicted nucleic acid-binding protein
VASSTCSAYDCEYVALAEELAVPLVTADRQLLTRFGERVVSVRPFGGIAARCSPESPIPR